MRESGEKQSLLTSVFQLVDAVVELYLGSVIKPFVSVHETFYAGLNLVLRKVLDDHAAQVPAWFTANFVTYFRTALVIPTLLFLAWDCHWLAAVFVVVVDLGDFLDGVVARFWVDERKKRPPPSEGSSTSRGETVVGSHSPTNSDDESFGAFASGGVWHLRTPRIVRVALTFVFRVWCLLQQRWSRQALRMLYSPG